ncbi:beta-Casp domain-containing protein [Knoellia flava TL1]|uniref:MBL fold metallo-hydrolase n=2 Tax=Knoellia flava TaxID=913969 RepID=A0A8H9FT09_9MICO|nr:MBL fold metallo-hydrolase [Knoellia flava]KGN35635.1 beta-Casp domain-containing protein [Knoellia flava TL1]GGB76878.1 MBL fold metallo-hydrolase [Knoellia flava]
MSAVLTFLGAAGTVTGSKTLVEHDRRRALVDCGLYQGERQWRRLNWEPFRVPASSIEDVVLTHTHLDHCGYLPALVRQGFAGPAWCSRASAALVPIVLRDSAHLLENEAEWARTSGYSRHDPPLPLYTANDAERAIESLEVTAYDRPTALRSGGELTLVRAGHVLGSASALLEVGGTSVLFSGDLGRPHHPLLRPRAAPPAARHVVVEATYGDRTHPGDDPDHHEMAATIRRTVERGGSVLVPAFAVDRTELVLEALGRLRSEGLIPDVPIHLDSPMALKVLEVYRSSVAEGELAEDIETTLRALPRWQLALTADESRALNRPRSPSIIVSASGMANGGRVVHHLAGMLPDPRHTVLLTGYQAVGTRGRALADGAHEVKIAGSYVPVRAEIAHDEGFSVHADADELLGWLHELPRPPESVFVTHGEPSSAQALAERIRSELDAAVIVPRLGERVRVD